MDHRLRGRAVDVLVVGAGPTGLALAAQAHAHGATVRVVDRAADRVHESRALAVQARTLEVLARTGVSEALLARGNRAARLVLHGQGATARVRLFDLGLDDTAYPFVLFVSQAQTEAALMEHLTVEGLGVQRRVELVGLADAPDGMEASLVGPGGPEQVRARYVVGCDGARSTVRRLVGVPFRGAAYPQAFVLADLEIDGDLEAGTLHAYLTRHGVALLFPLGTPATWRLIALRDPGTAPAPITLPELQRLVDRLTGARLRLRDPVWLSDFAVSCRQAAAYRAGRAFLAGDAAHVHSPAGGQGMNVGIQDAWNLGWKLGLVARRRAPEELLDSYELERLPVGRDVLRFTDRLFTIATNRRFAAMRALVAPRVAPLALALPLRSYAFRVIGQLSVSYRHSPAVTDAGGRRRGLRAGDRLPDLPVEGAAAGRSLHDVVRAPGFHVLVPGGAAAPKISGWADLVAVHRLAGPRLRAPYLVVRPDAYVGYAGPDPAGVEAYLRRWLVPAG